MTNRETILFYIECESPWVQNEH